MIASVFNKTRPLNYLIIVLLVLFSFLAYSISNNYFSNDWQQIVVGTLKFFIVLASCLLVNFITLKNNLTKDNTYAVFLFFIFLLFFPTIFQNSQILISNFLLLLALRRLVSLKSMITPKEKIFDASFWIFLSALFHFWSILYIVLVFVSIVLHASRDFRNWIIPFIALFSVSVLFLMTNLYFDNALFLHIKNQSYFSFDFTYFDTVYQNIALAVFAAIAVLFFGNSVLTIGNKLLNMQVSHKKIHFSFLLGIAIYILSANKNNSCLAFSLAPLAIMGANFIEDIQSKLLKDITLYVLLGFGLFFFIVSL